MGLRFVYLHVCVYLCMYVKLYEDMWYVCADARVDEYMYVGVYVFACMSVCMSACMYVWYRLIMLSRADNRCRQYAIKANATRKANYNRLAQIVRRT